jgi:formate dehydrogenase subunit delta
MAGDNSKTLVRMANQIGDFFEPYPDEEAVSGIQLHITKFWSPSMRRDLSAYIERGGDALKPRVLEAFRGFAQTAEAPVERAVPAPGHMGSMASDAG